MDEIQTAKLDRQYRTVGEFLKASIRTTKKLGSGSTSDVYPLPPLDDVVLRVNRRISDKHLSGCTELLPAQNLLAETNTGQRLLQSTGPESVGGVRILVHQAGTSLESLVLPFEECKQHRYERVFQSILQLYNSSAQNPLVPLLDKALRFHKSGIEPDLALGNIKINGQTLDLVDQEDYILPSSRSNRASNAQRLNWCCQHLLDVFNGEPTAKSRSPESQDAFERDFLEIKKLVIEAQQILSNRYRGNNVPLLCFKSTEGIKAIALTDPPSKLVTELNRLMGIANAHQR